MKITQWKQQLPILFALACAVGLANAPLAYAVDSSWTNTIGGNWTDPNWRNGVPGATTNAFITNSLVAASSFTITNDVTGNTIANLTIWNLSTGTNTVLDAGNGLNPSGDAILGRNALLLLNGGAATVGGSMTISNLGRVVITNNSLLQIGATANGTLMSTGTIFIGTGGTLAAGVISNRSILATTGGGVISGTVANTYTPGASFGVAGINVGGAQGNGSLSLVGSQPFLNNVNGGSIVINSNGTLNVGGIDAASATASFTNRGAVTMLQGSATGNRTLTLNAGTVVIDTNGSLTMTHSPAPESGLTNFVNADVRNLGTVTLNSAGAPTRIFRSLTNFGSVSLGALAGAKTIIQQGSFLNDGDLNAFFQTTLAITNGGFINETNGAVSFGRGTILANFVEQRGLIALTNWGITASFLATNGTTRLSITNNGTITGYSSAGQNNNEIVALSNLVNNGTFTLYGSSNGVNGIPGTQITFIGSGNQGNLINQPGGIVNAQSNALASFDAQFVNQGTINIQSNSVLSRGHTGVGANSSTAPTTFSFTGGTLGATNDGTVNMEAGSFFAVSSLTNTPNGTLAGAGHIGPVRFQTITNSSGTVTQFVQNVTVANIANAGTIAPSGVLNAGAITNLSGGQIVGSGVIQSINTSNYFSGLTLINSNIYTGARILNNSGATILASGGTLVLSNGFVTNSNAGTIGATNGTLQLGDGSLALTNNGTISIYNGGLNIGALRNNGIIQIVNSTVTFSNSVVNAGRYISDSSTNTFVSDVTIMPSGTLEGGSGDLFEFKKDLLINSTNTTQFNLVLSTVSFTGGADHTNAITGLDFDNSPAFGESHGYTATNFAYGTLRLGASDDLYLIDGDGSGANTNGLYIGVLDIGGTTNNVSLLHSPFNIYYRDGLAENAYLGGQTYGLDQGGFLIPVPEPSTILLLSCGALLIIARRRRGDL